MTRREAARLAKEMSRDLSVSVIGLRRWSQGSYEIGARDLVSGYQFVVRSDDDWREMVAQRDEARCHE